MTRTSNKKANGPTMLIELAHVTRIIILKRGRLLRDCGSRSLSFLQARGDKSWLVGSLASPWPNAWDASHDLARRLKQEFGEHVYVEPDGKPGRYHELASLGDSGLGASPSEEGSAGSIGHSGISGGFGMTNQGGLFRPPSHHDFLPNVGAGFNTGSGNLSGSEPDLNGPRTTFPALATVPGWDELHECTKAMFAVEAAQITRDGYQAITGITVVDDASRIVALALQPNISKALKRFLRA